MGKEEFENTKNADEETIRAKKRYDATYKHVVLPKDIYEKLTTSKQEYGLDSYPKTIDHLLKIGSIYKPKVEKKVICKKCKDIVSVPESLKWDMKNLVHKHFGKECDGHLNEECAIKKKEEIEVNCPNCKKEEKHSLTSFDGLNFECKDCKKKFELKEKQKAPNEF